MICPTCRYNDPPGFVRNGAAFEPCPDCGGTIVAHCCDGLTACNDLVAEALDADTATNDSTRSLPASRTKAAMRPFIRRCCFLSAVAGWHTAALANPITIVEWMKGFEMVLSERQETGICTRVNRAF